MGKKGGSGSSWLTAVKRAFRSPNKDSEKRNNRRGEEQGNHDNGEEEEEKVRLLKLIYFVDLISLHNQTNVMSMLLCGIRAEEGEAEMDFSQALKSRNGYPETPTEGDRWRND